MKQLLIYLFLSLFFLFLFHCVLILNYAYARRYCFLFEGRHPMNSHMKCGVENIKNRCIIFVAFCRVLNRPITVTTVSFRQIFVFLLDLENSLSLSLFFFSLNFIVSLVFIFFFFLLTTTKVYKKRTPMEILLLVLLLFFIRYVFLLRFF